MIGDVPKPQKGNVPFQKQIVLCQWNGDEPVSYTNASFPPPGTPGYGCPRQQNRVKEVKRERYLKVLSVTPWLETHTHTLSQFVHSCPVAMVPISAVRAVVPNRSNNEIVLVLQHHDNSVDRAVQAFVDDPTGVVFDTQSKMVMSQGGSFEKMKEKISAVRAVVPNRSNNEIVLVLQHHDNSVDRAVQAFVDASNIDKSVKDLQRCTASLTRYRVVVKEEMDCSIKKMKQTFAELQSCLMDREVALLAEMDKVKAEAMAILDSRQKKAEVLRRLSEQAVVMSEEQLSELRADIKHFVSERKYDEDLGKAVKFTYELEPAKKSIMTFGQVYHPQTGYSNRSRCSSVSSPSTLDCPPSVPQASGYSPPSSSPRAPPPSQPQRQGYQGNRRPGQGYQPRGQRPNGASYQGRYEDRNRDNNRINFSYQSRAQPRTASTASPANPSPPTNGTTAPPRPRQDQPNGLPQRPPRTHCPPPGP
ncbi:UNVERIFIED_CONTAM: hypothetical protein FKN15_068019 [Acipenser sinensis]